MRYEKAIVKSERRPAKPVEYQIVNTQERGLENEKDRTELKVVEYEGRLGGTISLPKGSEIKVGLIEHKDRLYVDIREWVYGTNYQGPTKKGIRISIDHLNELFSFLRRVVLILNGDSDYEEDEYDAEEEELL